MKSELGSQATDQEVAHHFCDQYVDVAFNGITHFNL